MNETRIDLRAQSAERKEKIRRTAELVFAFNNAPMFTEQHEEALAKLFPLRGKNCFMHPPIYINIAENLHLGSNVAINPYFKCMAAGNIFIDDGAQIAVGVSLITNNHDFYDRAVITVKDIHIGRNAWIGAGAIILAGVTIGENAVVGAGSVVTHDVAANTVVAGNPARVIRTLDENKFLEVA